MAMIGHTLLNNDGTQDTISAKRVVLDIGKRHSTAAPSPANANGAKPANKTPTLPATNNAFFMIAKGIS